MDIELKNIIEKVGALYLRYGIKSVTMDDIARHLGISKKTLYSYVKDKKELVELTIEAQLQQHRMIEEGFNKKTMGALDELQIVYEVARELLKKMNPSYQYDLNKYYPNLCDKLNGYRKDHIYQKIKANLIKGKNEGIYRAELDEEVIARMHAAQQQSLSNSKHEDLMYFVGQRIFDELFAYHLYAILNDKGREELKQRNFFQNN